MEPSSPGTSSVVLVVEDEMLVRMIAAEVPAEAGFTVIECASAEEALAVLHARADVQVVFTDVNMPGTLDGLTLAHIVHQQWPAVGIAIGSGRIRPDPGELPPGSLFLAKPYVCSALTDAVCALAGAQQTPTPTLRPQ